MNDEPGSVPVGSNIPPLAPQVPSSRGCAGPVSPGWGGASFRLAALPLHLSTVTVLPARAALLLAGVTSARRLVALLFLNRLVPIWVTPSVPCDVWPHPLIGSTCVYLSNEMVISTRPEVTFYRQIIWQVTPQLLVTRPFFLNERTPASPPVRCKWPCRAASETSALLRGGGSMFFFPLPPSRCPECSAGPRSLTPWSGGRSRSACLLIS